MLGLGFGVGGGKSCVCSLSHIGFQLLLVNSDRLSLLQ